MADILMSTEQFADCEAVVRIGGDDVEDPNRDSGAQSKLGGGERCKGREFCWVQDAGQPAERAGATLRVTITNGKF